MTHRKPQPTPIDLAREARRLAQLRATPRLRSVDEPSKSPYPRFDGQSGDDPKAAA